MHVLIPRNAAIYRTCLIACNALVRGCLKAHIVLGSSNTVLASSKSPIQRGNKTRSCVIVQCAGYSFPIFILHAEKSFPNHIKSIRNQIIFTIFRMIKITEKYFRNLNKSNRNQIVFTIFPLI